MGTVGRPGAPDGYHCGIDAAMDVIGGKWKVLILWALQEEGPQRFGRLRRMLPGVTEKVLTAQLRELEASGIVSREVYDEVPPRVEYTLTGPGAELSAALEPLGLWGRTHVLGRDGETPGGGQRAAAEVHGRRHGSENRRMSGGRQTVYKTPTL